MSYTVESCGKLQVALVRPPWSRPDVGAVVSSRYLERIALTGAAPNDPVVVRMLVKPEQICRSRVMMVKLSVVADDRVCYTSRCC